MEKDIREQIALARYAIISPVLAEPGRVQNQYFREQAEREHHFPRYGARRLKVSTMKAWLRRYRKEGFEGLKPKKRSDGGRPRRLTEEMLKAIEVKAKAYPAWSVQRLYEDLCGQGLLGDPPVHYNTLLRVVRAHGWLPAKGRRDVRKSFETEQVHELWLCDFLHGPPVRHGSLSAKAILCAIIDDHSRLIVGHGWNTSETISSLTVVLKEAFLACGIPKRLYVDYVKLHIIDVMLGFALCEDGAGTSLILNDFFMLRDSSTQHNQRAWSQARISGFALQEGTVEGMAA